MGRHFISLIVVIILVMGFLGWLVLNDHRYSNETLANTTPSSSESDSIGRGQASSAFSKQERQDQQVNPESADQTELLRVAMDLRSRNRVEAILKLIDVEQTGETLVPELAKLLGDQNELVTIAASIVLQKIGPSGAEHLRPLMESENSMEIAAACTALKNMGGAHLYLPLMRTWLTSTDSEIRKRALISLQGSNEGVLEVLQEITDTLEDKDFNVQCMACRVLVGLGPDGLDSIAQVLEVHKTGNPSARSWAAVALGALGPNTEFDTAEYLASKLDVFSHPEKQKTLEGLALMGAEASSVAEVVREVMNDPQKRVMPDAAYTLWRITGETAEPLKVLDASLDDPSYIQDTVLLLGKMGAAAQPLVGKLIKLLSTSEPGDWESTIQTLGKIGPAAAAALPALQSIAENPDADALNRYYAQEAIKKIKDT